MTKRINEGNTGIWSVDSQPKARPTKADKFLSADEKRLLTQVLEKVLDCLERDESGPGPLSPESRWTDNGDFTVLMSGNQKDALYNALEKLINGNA